jgi:hypothetical protein
VTSPPANPELDELVTFVQHRLPGLDDGKYQLTISQGVEDSAGVPVNSDAITRQYVFAVHGDRFAISDPTASVYSTFPAQNATGDFSGVFPHVVLTRPTYPWQRFPNDVLPQPPPTPPGDLDADVPTWLAVLILDDDDVAATQGALSLAPKAATVKDLFTTAVVTGSTLGTNPSYFSSVTEPGKAAAELEPGQTMDDAIQVIDVPLSLFWSLAPTMEDLEQTAHVRDVSLLNKATGRGADPGEPLGSFGVVFGNRLPQSGKKTYAYLVSLEGMESLLPTDAGGPPAGTPWSGTQLIRLAVLAGWQFYAVGDPSTFVHALLSLNGRKPPSTEPATMTTLALPYAGSNPVVTGALGMGYAPLDEQLRTGEKTVSWYRGPFVPAVVTDTVLPLPIASPDQVTSFDPTTGMLDVSYAAAWTLGRQLALQDPAFSVALYNWKRGLTQQAVDAVEHEVLTEAFRPDPTDPVGSLLHAAMRGLAASHPDPASRPE